LKNVILITNVFPHYRKSIWKLLIDNPLYDLKIYYGLNNNIGLFSPPINDSFSFENTKKIKGVKNYWVFKKYLFWQGGLFKPVVTSRFDIIILLGDIATLSTWIWILISKIRNKKIILWSHGIYGNESLIVKHIRLFQLSLGDELLIYGERAKGLLLKYGFEDKNIKVVFNSLDYDYQKELFNDLKSTSTKFDYFFDNNLPTILFIGRITKEKKIFQLFEAFNLLNTDSYRYNLLIIGDGSEKQSLEIKYHQLIKEKKVHFYGSEFDEIKIAYHIYNSDLCVSPGNVGLTAVHSLTYNTPLITHDNFKNQMPEAEIIINGVNGFLFKEDDVFDLSQKIELWFEQNNLSYNHRKLIEEKYNPYYQSQIITKVIKGND